MAVHFFLRGEPTSCPPVSSYGYYNVEVFETMSLVGRQRLHDKMCGLQGACDSGRFSAFRVYKSYTPKPQQTGCASRACLLEFLIEFEYSSAAPKVTGKPLLNPLKPTNLGAGVQVIRYPV